MMGAVGLGPGGSGTYSLEASGFDAGDCAASDFAGDVDAAAFGGFGFGAKGFSSATDHLLFDCAEERAPFPVVHLNPYAVAIIEERRLWLGIADRLDRTQFRNA